LIAIALINLVVWSVVIGGYVLIGEPLRPSASSEAQVARETLLGLLLASGVAVGSAFLALLYTTSHGRGPLLLSLISGLAAAVGLIYLANIIAIWIAYDSMAIVGPTLTAFVPIGVALGALLLSAVSPDRKQASTRLGFGLGVGLGLILFLLNLTNGHMNVLYT
jgi:hypothetical protein